MKKKRSVHHFTSVWLIRYAVPRRAGRGTRTWDRSLVAGKTMEDAMALFRAVYPKRKISGVDQYETSIIIPS